MRWKANNPKVGDVRVKMGFLWLPVTLQGETRWLEYAHIYQVFTLKQGMYKDRRYWGNTYWVERVK